MQASIQAARVRTNTKTPTFEVVSIKPADIKESTPATNGVHISPGRFYDGYVTTEGLIRFAYDIQFNSGLTGGPVWTKFAVATSMPSPRPWTRS